MVVETGGGQPNAGRQLVVEEGELRDEALSLLLLGGQRGQALPDGHQGLDELPLGCKADGLNEVAVQGGRERKVGARLTEKQPVLFESSAEQRMSQVGLLPTWGTSQ